MIATHDQRLTRRCDRVVALLDGRINERLVDVAEICLANNCLRNRRRSLVTASIAMLGTAAILLAGGFALFTYESLAQAAARDTGHLVLGTPAHFSADEDMPLQHGLDDVAALLSARVAGRPGRAGRAAARGVQRPDQQRRPRPP